MEKSIESIIDNGLESISSGLYIFSIGLGIVLVTLGTIIFLNNKGLKYNEKTANKVKTCFVIGIIAIISGTIQI